MKRSTTADAPPSPPAEMSGAVTLLPGVPLSIGGEWGSDPVTAATAGSPHASLTLSDLHRLPAPAGHPLVAPAVPSANSTTPPPSTPPPPHPGHRLDRAPKGSRRGTQPKPPKAQKPAKPAKPATAAKPAPEGSRRRLFMLIALAVVAAGAVAYYLTVLLPSMSEV